MTAKSDVVLVAAGSGVRTGSTKNKIFHPVGGVPIIRIIVNRLLACGRIDRVLLVINERDRSELESLFETQLKTKLLPPFVTGGAQRSDSVCNGLKYFENNPKNPIVMVHDAARPFITQTLINRLTDAALDYPIVIPAIHVVDTIREKTPQGLRRIDRKKLLAIQTPQAFRTKYIKSIFLSQGPNKPSLTDEAAYFEQAGLQVEAIEGERINIKITHAEDLILAESIVEHMDRIL